MTIGDDSTQLPDGEELVVIDRPDWLDSSPGRNPRETSLALRRQAGKPDRAYPAPVAPRASSAHPAT
jgi:hypothetical protein